MIKKGCCQLQAKVCARGTGLPLVQACPDKSVVSRTAMTIAFDWDVKHKKTIVPANTFSTSTLPTADKLFCSMTQHVLNGSAVHDHGSKTSNP